MTAADVEQLYRATIKRVTRFAATRIGASDADDVAADAFLELLSKRDFARFLVAGLVFRIARNRAIDWRRRRAPFVSMNEEALIDAEARERRREYGWRIVPPPRRQVWE